MMSTRVYRLFRSCTAALLLAALLLLTVFVFVSCGKPPAAESSAAADSAQEGSKGPEAESTAESVRPEASADPVSEGPEAREPSSADEGSEGSESGSSVPPEDDSSAQSEGPARETSRETSKETSADVFPSAGVKTVTFVSVNDLHGYILQDSNGKNGIANTARGIDRLSKYYGDADPDTTVRDDLVLFANGDMFQGTAVSNRSNGLAVLMAMNMMKFDAMGIGNHEFDWMLETILPYWDGSKANGEADFPLLSANVEKISAGKLLADVSDGDRIADGLLIRKEGVRIGLISCIGQVRGSILASAVEDYRFADVTESVRRVAEKLRAQGAELVCVSVHDGNAGSVLDYEENQAIALLKGSDGRYLVDVLFNGHTHTMQKGQIARPGGTALPIVQAGANNSGYGYVRVTYDRDAGETRIDGYGCLSVADLGTDCDPSVAEAVKRYADEISGEDGVLAVSGIRLSSKRDYADYVGDIMIRAFGADFSIGNYGGLRGTAGIVSGTEITLDHVYEMIPFDNTVYVVRIPGKELYEFYVANESYYYLGVSDDVSPLYALRNSSNLYTLAIIDYVYTSSYFNQARRAVRNEVKTGFILRDLLAEDIACFGRDGEKWNPHKGPRLDQQYFPG